MALRLRLKFQRGVLSNSQRSDGLNRSWILLTPHHETISDVVSHLLHTFDLHEACPNGVLLSMDGYVLPPFEPTSILRDKDVIWVKRKGVKIVDVIQEYKRQTALLEHIAEKKQELNACLQLLPNEELENETAGYESENEENEDKNKQTDVLQEEIMPNVDMPVKKRKASKELKTPKRKRQRKVLHENDEHEAEKELDDACLLNEDLSKKSPKNKQDQIPEFDRKNSSVLSHKANGKKKSQQQVLHDNDEQEAQKEHDDACLLNEDFHKKSSKNKKDHIPESNGENLCSVKHKTNTKKRRRQVLHDSDEHKAQKETDDACMLDGDLSKKPLKNKQDHIPEIDEEDLGSVKHNANTNSINENGDGTLTPDPSNRTGQSRSARRKKAKREWKRRTRLSEKEQLLKKQSLEDDLKGDLGSNQHQNLDTENQHPEPEPEPEEDEGCGTEEDVVAVMIGPGHFRFTAPGKEKDFEQNDVEKESFNWSGITNKRKGQKWGRGNQSASKWNENKAPYENQSSPQRDECLPPRDQQSHPMQNDSVTPSRNHDTQAPLENASIDYEKLAPMTDSPLEGDIIAYRLVELTSSFCPELTDYRVGKVSWFEAESNRVMLVPVPQYPFELTKTADDDTSEEIPDTSSYNEDGSLEIEFQSLVDVRIVKHGEVSPAPAVQQKANGAPAVQQKANGAPASGLGSSSGSVLGTEPQGKASSTTQAQPVGNNETGVKSSASGPEPGCNRENGKKDAWEEISAALSAKKAELLEDNWNKKRAPWSHRAMRSSALGPTLAILRAQNHHQTK